jgi:hypothetical protein
MPMFVPHVATVKERVLWHIFYQSQFSFFLLLAVLIVGIGESGAVSYFLRLSCLADTSLKKNE